MTDLFAFIADNPTALPLWATVVLALGMYPVGLMLGADCSPCCGCSACRTGVLPKTITVEIDGYADKMVPGDPLTWLEFTACMGAGAAGHISEPGVTPGPIESVLVTAGGYGYAVLGREEPTLTLTGGSGEGAELEIILAQEFDEACDQIPKWKIDSVNIINGGEGYPNGYHNNEYLTVEKAVDDTMEIQAVVKIKTTVSEPHINAEAPPGGEGATFSVTIEKYPEWQMEDTWYVSDIQVVSGGTGYNQWDFLTLVADTGNGDVEIQAAAAYIEVDENGTVIAAYVYDYGMYYNTDGIISDVIVEDPGAYFREGADLPAIVADDIEVIIHVDPWSPSIGEGGELEAVVDDDPNSPTFGQIIGADVVAAGDGYLAYEEVKKQCCENHYNGQSVVLKQDAGNRCLYRHPWCGTSHIGFLDPSGVTVQYRGPNAVPIVGIGEVYYSECNAGLDGDRLIEDCSDFSFTATNNDPNSPTFGVTATVSPGGEYDEKYLAEDNLCGSRCHPCCRGKGEPPCEIEADVSEGEGEPVTVIMDRDPYAGSYVGYRYRFGEFPTGGAAGPYLQVIVLPCDHADTVAPNCRNCWEKCETIASLSYNHPTISPPYRYSLFYRSDLCQNCEDTIESGMCQPQAGTYVCKWQPNSVGGDPNSTWTVVVK